MIGCYEMACRFGGSTIDIYILCPSLVDTEHIRAQFYVWNELALIYWIHSDSFLLLYYLCVWFGLAWFLSGQLYWSFVYSKFAKWSFFFLTKQMWLLRLKSAMHGINCVYSPLESYVFYPPARVTTFYSEIVYVLIKRFVLMLNFTRNRETRKYTNC